MKKLLLACSLVGIIAGASADSMMGESCSGECPHQMMRMHKFEPAERAEHLQKTLQLSDEQAAKVKKLFQDKEQQREQITNKYKPQFDAFHDDMKKLHEQTHTQLNGILTPKQQEALKTQQEAHGRYGAHGGHKEHGDMCPRDGKPLADKPVEKPTK